MTEPTSMSPREAEAALCKIAELAASQLPLSEGLRAAAYEAKGRLASGLRTLADELEAGRTLEQVTADPNLNLPPHVRGMVLAATRTGQLGPALEELLEHQAAVRSTFWQIWLSLAYPVTVFTLNLGIIAFLLCGIVPVFRRMFLEFELTLPAITQFMITVSDGAVWLVQGPGQPALLSIFLGILVFFVLASTGRGGAVVQRLLIESIPIIGSLWHWSGAASFTYLLGALLDKNIPLVEALHLTAEGTRKMDLRQAGHRLADQVAGGRSLADAAEASESLPASVIPLLRWGERNNALPEAMRTISGMLFDRVQSRADWLRSVSPPFVYLFIGLSVGAVIVCLFAPLVSLIQGLS